jgi:hypothetical protein
MKSMHMSTGREHVGSVLFVDVVIVNRRYVHCSSWNEAHASVLESVHLPHCSLARSQEAEFDPMQEHGALRTQAVQFVNDPFRIDKPVLYHRCGLMIQQHNAAEIDKTSIF